MEVFAPLKYQFSLQIFSKDSNMSDLKVKAFLFEEFGEKKEKIHGDLQIQMSREGEMYFSGEMKLKFDKSLSFYKTKKKVFVKFQFFIANDLQSPIFTIQSPPSKVYSRRPKKNKKKRKREREIIQTEKKPRKRRKLEKKKVEYSDFEQKLKELMEIKEQLSIEDQGKSDQLLFGIVSSAFTPICNTMQPILPVLPEKPICMEEIEMEGTLDFGDTDSSDNSDQEDFIEMSPFFDQPMDLPFISV